MPQTGNLFFDSSLKRKGLRCIILLCNKATS